MRQLRAFQSDLLHRLQSSHGLNAAPEVLHTDVLVRRMLVVVIVGDRHRDGMRT